MSVQYAGKRAKLSEKSKTRKVWNLLPMPTAFKRSSDLVRRARSEVLTRLQLSKKYVAEGTPSKWHMRGYICVPIRVKARGPAALGVALLEPASQYLEIGPPTGTWGSAIN